MDENRNLLPGDTATGDADRPLEKTTAGNRQIYTDAHAVVRAIETGDERLVGRQRAILTRRDIFEDRRTVSACTGGRDGRFTAGAAPRGIEPNLGHDVFERTGTDILRFERSMRLREDMHRNRPTRGHA